jgi:hypothetical protein
LATQSSQRDGGPGMVTATLENAQLFAHFRLTLAMKMRNNVRI